MWTPSLLLLKTKLYYQEPTRKQKLVMWLKSFVKKGHYNE
jgi:hypothetical protein